MLLIRSCKYSGTFLQSKDKQSIGEFETAKAYCSSLNILAVIIFIAAVVVLVVSGSVEFSVGSSSSSTQLI